MIARAPRARFGNGGRRLVMIDNYDSFTFNLVQILVTLDLEVEVVRNDDIGVDELLGLGAVAVVVSPGPGRPEDAGICVELFARTAPLPILGVCLGHQALGQAFGATVGRAATQMHGKTSRVTFVDDPLFDGLEQGFEATRYHSLCVDPASLPADLEPLAWSEDDRTLMAMRHRRLPYWGVQFHPESVLTTSGPRLMRNFVDLATAQAAAAAVR